jgi:hypothetical protein
MNGRIETDSGEYEVLIDAVKRIKNVKGMLCEIGTRRGGSLAHIVNTLGANEDFDRNIAFIDPYGNIDYAHRENEIVTMDYNNVMRNETLAVLYTQLHSYRVNVVPFIMEDTEFFKRFADGVPFYNNGKIVENEYALVFFDGPHDVMSVIKEVMFFNTRSPLNSMWVFDDISFYNHDQVENLLFQTGWKPIQKGGIKASYKKEML